MPVTIKNVGKGKFQVRTPNQVHAKGTTKEKAMAQERLLNAVEHGWKPTGKKMRKLRDKSLHGSAPFTDKEIMQGYRKL